MPPCLTELQRKREDETEDFSAYEQKYMRKLENTMGELVRVNVERKRLEIENSRLLEKVKCAGIMDVEYAQVATTEKERMETTMSGLERQIQDCNEEFQVMDGKLKAMTDERNVRI